MNTDSIIIQPAEFNPRIKEYLLVYVAFIMTITVVGIPLLIIWFLGYGQYICKRYYENLKCKLTDRHLVFAKGIFFTPPDFIREGRTVGGASNIRDGVKFRLIPAHCLLTH